jgi:hypothetical protein
MKTTRAPRGAARHRFFQFGVGQTFDRFDGAFELAAGKAFDGIDRTEEFVVVQPVDRRQRSQQVAVGDAFEDVFQAVDLDFERGDFSFEGRFVRRAVGAVRTGLAIAAGRPGGTGLSDGVPGDLAPSACPLTR